ncbi:type II secretion system F family protein [Phytoactinopolyspora halotolerans]|uniref:Type II secretion system protein GspF domain-containing protein n=1 Tax=Phytoactinopolyspora halotolerans TaxID=1981512 RepID=A0A6L9S103_9ACTN|nr:type II secretion system F family protein [Phytoactinopolyspora halotolerans]NED99134.1 hypothetical protein [Phytoactinopolyspora halotolerans]
MTALAMALAAAAAALSVGGRPNPLVARLGRSPRVAQRPTRFPAVGRSRPYSVLVQSIAGAILGCVAGAVLAPPGGAVVGALVVPLIAGYRARSRVGEQRRSRESAVAEGCLTLATDLRAGLPAERALAAAALDWPELFGPAAGRLAVGGDPATALRATAAQPGAAPLTAVAAAWEVSARTGASLATTLTAVTDALRAEAAVRHEAEAQLAAVRSTARLLALLPLGTLLLFSSGDAAPVNFLLRTSTGMACLLGAASFVAVGLWWVERTSRLALRTPWSR